MVSTLSHGSSKSSTQIKRKWKQSSKSASIPNNPAVLGLSSVSLLRLHLKKGTIMMQWSGSTKTFAQCDLFIYLPIDSVTAPEAPGYGEQLSILRGKTNKDLQWLSHYGERLFSKFSFFPNLKKKKITFSTRKQRQADIRVWGQLVYRMRRCFKKGLGDEGEHYLPGHLFQATTKLYYFLLFLTIQKSLGLDSRHANRRYLHTGWCAGWLYINLTQARVL